MASFRFMLAALTGTAASLCASWVAAQAVAPVTSGSSTELAEIIVTATRRAESIQNVPSSVTALTSSTLEQIKARDLNDFAGFVPGLSFASTGPSTNLLVIRGITTGSQLSSATGVLAAGSLRCRSRVCAAYPVRFECGPGRNGRGLPASQYLDTRDRPPG